MEEKIRRYITLAFALAGLVFISLLIYRNFAPFGKIVNYRFTSKLPNTQQITTYSPAKNSFLKIPGQIIKTAQSRMSLDLLSKDIDSIRAVIKFKKGPSEIKLGVKGNEKDVFYFQPLYFSVIQDLNWKKIEENGLTLWQRDEKFKNITELVNDTSDNLKLGTYFIDQNKLASLKLASSKKEGKMVIDKSFRGNHAFLINIIQSPLVIKITKQDDNSYPGEDRIKLTVLKDGEMIKEKFLEDDGITDTTSIKTMPQEETLTVDDASPGIYQANLTYLGDGYDSLITKIEVNQKELIFKNYVYALSDTPTTYWTNAKKISLEPMHNGSEQTLMLDDSKDLKVDQANTSTTFDLDAISQNKSRLHKIWSPKNDIKIQGDGYFSFSEASFFYTDIVKSTGLTAISDLTDFNNILSSLRQSKKEGDWLVSETIFSPKNIKVNGDKLYLSLDIPDLAKYGGELQIDYLEVEVRSKGMLGSPALPVESSNEPTPKPNDNKFPIRLSAPQLSLPKISLPDSDIFVEIGKAELKLLENIKSLFSSLPKISVPNFVPDFSKLTANIPFLSGNNKNQTKKPPASALKPVPTATPTPSLTITANVSVLNGGAERGAAGNFADVLKNNGFVNVKTGNAENLNYKNAVLKFNTESRLNADKISNLLKNFYENIQKIEIATASSNIVIILGAK